MSLLHFITEQAKHNQLVGGALLMGPASAALYGLRTLPGKVYRFCKKWVTLAIRFNNDMASYDEALRFITSEVICDRFTRNYNYQSESKWNWDDDVKEITSRSMAVGYGTHIGFFNRRLVIINRSIDEESKTEKFKEHTNVTLFARKKGILDDFKRAIEDFAGRARDGQEKVQLKVNSGTYWANAGKLPLRRMDTVFSANGAAKHVVDHIQAFDAKREWNHAKGLPHHTGILLYGPPGTGKSSLIHAVASETKRTLYYLSLASIEKDKEFTELLGGSTDWSKILLVIEDFDSHGLTLNRGGGGNTTTIDVAELAASGEVIVMDGPPPPEADEDGKKTKKEPISLSTILNVLDGLLSPDGLVVIATTNHPDRLDEALRRPGRFDLSIELGYIGHEQFEDMARLFEMDPDDYTLPTFQPMSGATMRSLLLQGGVKAIEDHQRALAA